MTPDDIVATRQAFMEAATRAPNIPPTVTGRRGARKVTWEKGSRGWWLDVIDSVDMLAGWTERDYVPEA